MRFYGFGNYYLSGLQQGVQAFHCLGDMSIAVAPGTAQYEIYYNWAKNHKTLILLNGGNSKSLAELFEFFEELKSIGMPYPFVKFHEDEQSLGGALTEVGIILPEQVYTLRDAFFRGMMTMEEAKDKYDEWDCRLAEKLTFYDLAH